jgi:SAM-dependent methyltransferase
VDSGAESSAERARRETQRALFDGIAARYAAARPGYPPRVLAFLAGTAGLRPGCDVLEAGCGTGQLTEPLARAGYRVTAVDIGPALIAAARQRTAGLGVTFAVTPFEDLAVPAASFDLVTSAAAFHWIDPAAAFAKAARLLRPGGWLALLGNDEHYDDRVGPGLGALWAAHGNTGGAWQRHPSAPEAVTAAGLFGPPAFLADDERATLPADGVIALETTRATYLGWPPAVQDAFTGALRELLAPHPVVAFTRRTTITLAQLPA